MYKFIAVSTFFIHLGYIRPFIPEWEFIRTEICLLYRSEYFWYLIKTLPAMTFESISLNPLQGLVWKLTQ